MVLGHTIYHYFDVALITLSFMVGSWGFGYTIYHFLDRRRTLNFDEHVFSIALGMGVIGHLVLVFGLFIKLNQYFAIIILVFGCLIGFYHLYQLKGILIKIRPIKSLMASHYVSIFSIAALSLIAISFLFPLIANALVPPLSYDEIAYHLAIPKLYIQQGRIGYISFIPYSNWPLENEMLYLLGLLLSTDKFAHLVTWLDMALICLGLFYFGKRYINKNTGLLAALIFSMTPAITFLSGTALVEIPLTLFTFFAIYQFFNWINTNQYKYLVISAIFCGLAASTKLNAAVTAVIIGFLLIIEGVLKRKKFWVIVRIYLVFGLISFLVVSPWYLKSWFLTGDPLWPFLSNIFPTRNWDLLGTTYLMSFIQSPNLPINIINYVRAFWIVTSKPGIIGPSIYGFGWTYLVLLPIVIVAIFMTRNLKQKTLSWFAVLALLFYTSWFFQTHQARFLVPILPALAMIVAISFDWLENIAPRSLQYILQIALIVVLIVNSWISNPGERVLVSQNIPYIIGQKSRNDFLQSRLSGYKTMEYINTNLPKNAKIWMALYESRGYYLDRSYEWANPISQRVMHLEGYANASLLASDLKKLGFTYILYNTINTARFNYVQYGPKYTRLMKNLLSGYAKLIYASDELELYQLNP